MTNDLIAHPDYVADELLPIADNPFHNPFVVEVSTAKVRFIEYSEGLRKQREITDSLDAFPMVIRANSD